MLTDSLLTPAGSTYRWRRNRLIVMERDQWRCQLRLKCDGARATHCDHIVSRADWPPGKPGVDEPGNLQAACAPCNLTKGRGTPREWWATARGWKW